MANSTHSDLERLRRYMADEVKRLGESGAGVVHRIDLDGIDEQADSGQPGNPEDPLERDVDLLYRWSDRKRRPS